MFQKELLRPLLRLVAVAPLVEVLAVLLAVVLVLATLQK
jgi:biopolymer transport protein ExbD